MEKEIILVTGGAGFIGSHVNKLLNTLGYQTVVLDNLSKGSKEMVTSGTFVYGDLADKKVLEKLFKNYSFASVMHFAASIDVGESVLDPAKYYKNNVVNTINLLDVMLKHQVKNLIFSSTAAVYGDVKEGLVSEEHPKKPISPYGYTKLIVEEMLKDYHHAYGMNYIALRYFNAAGGDPDKKIKQYMLDKHNLIPILLKKAKDQEFKVNVFGNDYPTNDGTCIRDYIHVMDIANAHILAMKKLLKGGKSGVYNLGNGKGYSVKEVISAVEKVVDHPFKVTIDKRRKGDPAVLLANPQKAQKELNWKAQLGDIQTIIKDAWQAYF